MTGVGEVVLVTLVTFCANVGNVTRLEAMRGHPCASLHPFRFNMLVKARTRSVRFRGAKVARCVSTGNVRRPSRVAMSRSQ